MRKLLRACAVAALCSLSFLTLPALHAQVPQIINYQGRVAVGTVNFNGSGAFKFALVNAAGTTTYWSNDGTSTAGSQPTAAVTLAVTKGLYSVLLGDTALAGMTAIPNSVFANADVRLRVWFNDGTNGSQLLTPDQRLAAVGYAMVAGGVNLPATTSSTAGVITQNGTPLIHTFGPSNFFAGPGAGNFTTTGTWNTASGIQALSLNAAGQQNTANGFRALPNNTDGSNNTATGYGALNNTSTGSNNIGLGRFGGFNITGSNNIAIGHLGVAGESNIIRIGTAQTDTFLTGIIHGNGSALTGVPTSALTGTITGAQLANNTVGSTQLASGLTLGGITLGTFSGTLTGNVTGNVSGSATSFTGNFAGEVTGAQGTTVVASVGGVIAANVAAGANLANAATTASTPNTIVKRDGSGNIPGITATPPPGMVLIPAGAFTMGDSLDGLGDATPTVSTTVSAFYMDVNEVTLSQWQSVYYWATSNGYTFGPGEGKGPNHPVQVVSWYDVVKWCNARSEQAGKTPVYYTNDAQTTIYKTGRVDVTNAQAKWTANGYRLPTEAEWEKAARGGRAGQRFPWGNTITQNLANYYGNTVSYAYDLGPNGYNAIGSIGGTLPATSPVGSFASNGYGLNDMAGNVFEWCWDWYGTPYAGGTDPHGAASGSDRVIRDGSGNNAAEFARCAGRSYYTPDFAGSRVGFRSVLPPGQ